MKTKNAVIGTLVKIFPLMATALPMTARVQDHLATQFTYSRPDSDDVIGICRFDGDFEDDFETIDTWKPEQETESCEDEFGCSDSTGSEVLDRPWLQSGRRRRKVSSGAV